jgi:hypothetical protein
MGLLSAALSSGSTFGGQMDEVGNRLQGVVQAQERRVGGGSLSRA